MKNNTTFNTPSIICVVASIGGLLYSIWKAKKVDKAISKYIAENTTSEH